MNLDQGDFIRVSKSMTKIICPGGWTLPYKRLMGMCRWLGSHFHDLTDCNGVAFSKELLEWGRTFSHFGVESCSYLRLSNVKGYLYSR